MSAIGELWRKKRPESRERKGQNHGKKELTSSYSHSPPTSIAPGTEALPTTHVRQIELGARLIHLSHCSLSWETRQEEEKVYKRSTVSSCWGENANSVETL